MKAVKLGDHSGAIQSFVFQFFLAALLQLSISCNDREDQSAPVEPPVQQFEIDTDPAWSPDDKKIIYFRHPAYESDTQWVWGVFLHDVATGEDSLLWPNFRAYYLTWSPDGEWVAYSHEAQIYARKLKGDSIRQLTSEGRNFRCRWSPAGGRIAYEVTTGARGLWLCGPDGKDKRILYENAAAPAWFSDGSSLAGLGLGGEIYLLDTLGKRYEKVTQTERLKYELVVAPDGRSIIYSERAQLWRLDLSSQTIEQLTTEGGDYPDWSSDGEWIVFTQLASENGHLWIMRPDGTQKKQITF